MANAFPIRNVYKTDEEIRNLIGRIERDIQDAKQFNTIDAKAKTRRLKNFLEEIKKETKF